MKYFIKNIVKNKYYYLVDILLFAVILCISSLIIVILFQRQAYTTSDLWRSDITAYIEEIKGNQDVYSFPYPIMFKLAEFLSIFLSYEWAMICAVTLLNLLSMILVKLIFVRYTNTYFLSTIATFCLFFSSMIYSPKLTIFGIKYNYLGVFSPNPWHNHTYISARPFMILAFVMGSIVIDRYERELEKGVVLTWKHKIMYITYAMALLMCTMTKPSYTLLNILVVGCIGVYRLILKRGKNLRQMILLAFCYIPTIIDMLYQYLGVFAESNYKVEKGIGIGVFRVWSKYTNNIPLAILLAAAFPIVVLLFHIKEFRKNELYKFSWQTYISGLVLASLLYEKGFRENDGNFFWGYICGLFLIFFTSLILILRETKIYLCTTGALRCKLILTIEWVALFIHTMFGITYFLGLLLYGYIYR